ncbi:YggT family protein [Simplicispira psychrophila]|uniref:YggT family protein n=1 Tax=Simplicispira psychrophila TaxID=80882 RepID=UPI0004851917|nr:YggT family protein [Simplicispira psychrophila]
MLYQIVSLLLNVAAGLLCSACLLRIYMQWQRIPFNNPIGGLIFAFTDWGVLPLRRILPTWGRWDWASLVLAALVELAQYVLLWLVLGAGAGWQWLPWLAVCGLVQVALTLMIGLLIVYAVMSWVQAHSPISVVIARLCEPLLRPLRRVLPQLGGLDLSPLVLLVLLQVALIVLGHVQASLLP